jgi:hypothetical protein
MCRFFSLPLLAILLVGCGIRDAEADPIYDNGSPNHTPGQVNGYEITTWIEADDFTVNVPTRLDAMTFWNFETADSFEGSIVWQVYSNTASNTPGDLLFTGSSSNGTHGATGFQYFAFREFLNSFDLPRISLLPGRYWIGIHNGPLSNNNTQNVFWETTANSGSIASQSDKTPFDQVWGSNTSPAELAFHLDGVAEPQITAVDINNNAPRITFSTVLGQTYRVEFEDSLTTSWWSSLPGAEMVSGSGSTVQVSDPDPNVRNFRRRFYRVLLL